MARQTGPYLVLAPAFPRRGFFFGSGRREGVVELACAGADAAGRENKNKRIRLIKGYT